METIMEFSHNTKNIKLERLQMFVSMVINTN